MPGAIAVEWRGLGDATTTFKFLARLSDLLATRRPSETNTRAEDLMHHSRTLLTAALALFVCACAPLSSVTIGSGGRHSLQADKHHHHGPPPHAPAHGYRHKHQHQGQDLEFIFDSDLGVYIVINVPDRYYWNGYYLRIDGDQWYASVNLDNGWEPRDEDSLPPGLKKHKKHPKGKHGRSGKHHPGRGHH